ncbi:MAG: TlpA family protein disulfide reductase, partial [Sinomicrobium sp.]|nr:TlpA family protein disulfide reductase [Sinomicrobium sp.]
MSLVCCKANDRKEGANALRSGSDDPGRVVTKDGITLQLYDYEGLEHFLSREDGKTYVINFWATWCKPCVEELPYFERLHENFKDRGVKVILVSLDMPGMIETQLIPFIRNRKLKPEVVVLDDPRQNMWISEIDENWSGAIPATLIYTNDKRA